MKCLNEECADETAVKITPDELMRFSIPFTHIEIRVWRWNGSKHEKYCMECLCDMESTKHNDILESAAQAGYNNALQDYISGKWD